MMNTPFFAIRIRHRENPVVHAGQQFDTRSGFEAAFPDVRSVSARGRADFGLSSKERSTIHAEGLTGGLPATCGRGGQVLQLTVQPPLQHDYTLEPSDDIIAELQSTVVQSRQRAERSRAELIQDLAAAVRELGASADAQVAVDVAAIAIMLRMASVK